METALRRGFFHVCLPIFAGAAIYAIFRPGNLRMFVWADSLGIAPFLMSVRGAAPQGAGIPHWVVYSLPNGLWGYAVMAFLILVWRDSQPFARYTWIGCGVALTIGSELGQFFGYVPGTFDGLDLLICLLAVVMSLALLYVHRSERESEPNKKWMTLK